VIADGNGRFRRWPTPCRPSCDGGRRGLDTASTPSGPEPSAGDPVPVPWDCRRLRGFSTHENDDYESWMRDESGTGVRRRHDRVELGASAGFARRPVQLSGHRTATADRSHGQGTAMWGSAGAAGVVVLAVGTTRVVRGGRREEAADPTRRSGRSTPGSVAGNRTGSPGTGVPAPTTAPVRARSLRREPCPRPRAAGHGGRDPPAGAVPSRGRRPGVAYHQI